MKYDVTCDGVILYEDNLCLSETLDCGQAFRWELTAPNTYTGAFLNYPLTISGENGKFLFHDVQEDEFLNIWVDYFDLETDYSVLKKGYSADPTMKLACEYASGIRLLRQDSWEALISFIFSQNNNIARIKGIIKRLCEYFGAFPTPMQLAEYTPEQLDFLRSGFRSKYIYDASCKVASGEIDLHAVSELPFDEAKAQLMTIKGVGPKVADCVLLYGMHRIDAFPQDVWIKRVMSEFYPNGLPECIQATKGIAQQFLFHYIRNNSKL